MSSGRGGRRVRCGRRGVVACARRYRGCSPLRPRAGHVPPRRWRACGPVTSGSVMLACGSGQVGQLGTRALAARRSSCFAFCLALPAARGCAGTASAGAGFFGLCQAPQAAQPVSFTAGHRAPALMQSTGQAGTQSSQPVQSRGPPRCACALLRAHDAVHRTGLDAQRAADAPGFVHQRATVRGASTPHGPGRAAAPVRPVMPGPGARMPSSPPGGHWLIRAWPAATGLCIGRGNPDNRSVCTGFCGSSGVQAVCQRQIPQIGRQVWQRGPGRQAGAGGQGSPPDYPRAVPGRAGAQAADLRARALRAGLAVYHRCGGVRAP